MSASAPPVFADLFWEHQHQPLTNLCTAYARCVSADVATFGEAVGVVAHHAWKRGAGYLPPDRWQTIHDWIITTLSEEILRADEEGSGDWLVNNHIVGGRVP